MGHFPLLNRLELEFEEQLTMKIVKNELIMTLAECYNQAPQKAKMTCLTADGFLRVEINGSSAAKQLKQRQEMKSQF